MIYIYTSNNLAYKAASINYIDNIVVRPNNCSKEYVKENVDKIFGNSFYILTFDNLKHPLAGYSRILIRYVCIDNNLSLENYALTLTHELVHLNYFTANERFTSFKTFQLLYESNNEYFRQIALGYANAEFSNNVVYEYSCAGYIEEYLRAQMII